MIPTNRQERYDAFLNNVKVDYSYYYQQHPYEWDELFQYLEGNRDTFVLNPTVFDNWAFTYVYNLVGHPYQWTAFDDRILKMMTDYWHLYPTSSPYCLKQERFLETWISTCLPFDNIGVPQAMNNILKKHGFTEGYVAIYLFNYAYQNNEVTVAGQYIVENIEEVFSMMPTIQHNAVFMALLKTDEAVLDRYLDKMIAADGANGIFGFYNVHALLAHNPAKYEFFVANLIKKDIKNAHAMQAGLWLSAHFPEKYDADLVALCYAYLDNMRKNGFAFEWFYNHLNHFSNHFLVVVFDILLSKQPLEKGLNTIQAFLTECPHTSERITTFLYEKLGERSLPILIEALSKKVTDYRSPETSVLENLKKHNHEAFYPQIWALLPKSAKKTRSLIARHLATVQGEAAIPNAEKLLGDKKGDMRLVGALILSLVKTEKALAILRGTLDNEKNDDARDAMLEGLAGLMSGESDPKVIFESIAQAKIRGKLDKPLAAWLETDAFPKLHDTTDTPLSKEAVDFLFYRMSRTKDIRIDVEAKPLIALIDKSKSAPFAKVLLKKYFENGADAKFKWCMTVGSILGGDDEMDIIKRKVNEWAEASRGKMAEYAVKALAMNGSTKALRAVEFFSRKYKSKNKNIGAAAIESFSVVAEELGISLYDLADSIIPDFGFEGLFRNFEVGGNEYRAYINNDFKIAFLDEDNRNLKALPKGASTDLKNEFKDTAKEIRDIVKSQSSRLEQYLVIQRKWSVEKWDAFFRGNPVMFAYAIRSIWGIFDEKQQIITTFQCLEDQTLVNMEGDELDFDDYTDGTSRDSREGYQIGMIHPMQLNEETINHWKEALADADVEPIFPQLARSVILLKEGDAGVKLCKEFNGIQFGGYAFVAKMEKLGWSRGSVVDGGGISSYYKDFSELGVTAIVEQTGCLSVGYYDENAELGDLMFVRAKSVSFGSYSYDEPSKNDDERLIALGDLPPIVYSEVMADMVFFKDNQIKKEEN